MPKQSTCFLIILLISSISCSDEFLEKEPPGISAENYFQDEKGIDALLIGTYSMVSGSALWEVSWGASIQNWSYGSIASDDAYKGSEETDSGPFGDIERWEVSAYSRAGADKWKWAFGLGVHSANSVLRVIEETKDISESKAILFKAEACFLRALFYFEAWLVFGDYIPLIDENTKDPSLVANLNEEGEVLTFIINDLQFAWENLPEMQEQPGRPTKYSAMALAARAYLEVINYTNAKSLLDEIINSGRFSLMPNFFDNFRIEKNNNAESVFEIQASVNDGASQSLNGEMGIGLNFPHAGDIGMCCGFHQPSQNLANAFKVSDDGLPLFDSFNDKDLKNDMGIKSDESFEPATHLLDPRIDWTLSRRGIPFLDWGINRGEDWVRKQRDGGPYLPAMKPFFYKFQRGVLSTTEGWMSGVNANNYRYIRYAHVLLWRAEVAAFEGDLELATNLVNEVRERAGNEVVMGKVLIYKLPESVYPWGEGTTDEDYLKGGDVDWTLPAANYKIGLYQSFSNASEAMQAVQWEQRLEFATEGRRFFDLRRWDKLPNKTGGKRMADILNDFATADLRVRPSFMKDASFSENDKYQPIPQSQLDQQPGVLVQRPGY